MVKKLESVEVKLKIAEAERGTLAKDFTSYKVSAPLLTKEAKQQIILEYRGSPELVNEVVEQFDLGYQDARARDKAKMQAQNLDPALRMMMKSRRNVILLWKNFLT